MQKYRIKEQNGEYTPQKRVGLLFWKDMSYPRVNAELALKYIEQNSGKASYLKVLEQEEDHAK